MSAETRSGTRTEGTVTLAMVAERAGVTKGTASRALNGHYGVSESTRSRVLAAAAEMGFARNEVARSLTTGRSETIGLLTSDLEGRFALPIMLGAERVLSADQGASILLSNANRDPDTEARRLRSLLSRRVDGILFVADRSDPRQPYPGPMPVPAVYVYGPSDDPGDASVIVDDVQGGHLAAEHLVEQGCRRIVHLGGQDDFLAAHQRQEGIERALADHGMHLAAPTRFRSWGDEWGWDGVADLLDSGVEFDGLICGSEFVARGALAELKDRGIRVPDQVKVIGFDNMAHTSPRTRPPLSSIDPNLGRLGEVAVEVLLDLQNGIPRPGTIMVAGSLVRRESTA